MVSRYHQSGAKERPDTPLFVDVDGRSTLKDYDDEAITVSIHKDVRDPLDAQPKVQEIVISNAVGELLLVKLTSLGEMTLRRVGMRDVTFMHLSRGMAEALVFQAYEWICDLERWDYEQEEKRLKKQANGHGPTQDQQEPPNPFAKHAREVLREYEDGFLTAGEMSAALRAMIEDEETAEAVRELPPLEQATREAADNAEQIVDLLTGEYIVRQCVSLGCQTPAFCKIGEFWYCDAHAKEPIPF